MNIGPKILEDYDKLQFNSTQSSKLSHVLISAREAHSKNISSVAKNNGRTEAADYDQENYTFDSRYKQKNLEISP